MFDLFGRKQRGRCRRFYAEAVSLYRRGQVEEAIFALGLSIGADPQPQAYRMLGCIHTERGEFEKAAFAHGEGRWLVMGDIPIKANNVPETVIRFYYDESLAFLRDGNWHFAIERSKVPIAMIESGRASRATEYGDVESWLRLVRMVAALHDSFDFATAHADALWLQQNSSVQGYRDIYQPILLGEPSDGRVSDVVLEQWLLYDTPLRTRPIIFDNHHH